MRRPLKYSSNRAVISFNPFTYASWLLQFSFCWKGKRAWGIFNCGHFVSGCLVGLSLLSDFPTQHTTRSLQQRVKRLLLAWWADRKNSASIKVPGPSPPLKSKLSDSCRTCDERKDSHVLLGTAESHSPEERVSVPRCCCSSRQLVWDDEVLPCCLHFKPPTSC